MKFQKPWRYEFALGVAVLWLIGFNPSGLAQTKLNGEADLTSSTTIYVNKYFEVREHDAPTKYVWNGNTRVARVTGSLTTPPRIQRIRVHAGWNLISLAVSATNATQQLADSQPSALNLQLTFRWNSTALGWDTVVPSETLPAGTVLWLAAITNATLTVTGAYADPTIRTVTAGGDFFPSAGLESWNIVSNLNSQLSISLWRYDASSTHWLSWLLLPLELRSAPTDFIAPGEAVFVRADTSVQLEVPESALRLRYYHQDHLGSSSSVTDDQGYAVEQTVFYPFGHPRIDYQPRNIQEGYKFTQKEEDPESELHYFASRYYASALGTFISCDSRYAFLNREQLVHTELVTDPKLLNLYAYASRAPITAIDPTGQKTVRITPRKITQVATDLLQKRIDSAWGRPELRGTISLARPLEGQSVDCVGVLHYVMQKAGLKPGSWIAGRFGDEGFDKLQKKGYGKHIIAAASASFSEGDLIAVVWKDEEGNVRAGHTGVVVKRAGKLQVLDSTRASAQRQLGDSIATTELEKWIREEGGELHGFRFRSKINVPDTRRERVKTHE